MELKARKGNRTDWRLRQVATSCRMGIPVPQFDDGEARGAPFS